MGFDINKINRLKKEKQDDKKKKIKDAKQKQKEAAQKHKEFEARLNNKVLNEWENFLDSTSDWQDDIQKRVESYIQDPCDFNKFRLIMTVTHTKTTIVDDIIEDGHDDIIIDHDEYEINSINISGRACNNLNITIPINEKDVDFDVCLGTFLDLMVDCKDIFIKVLRQNGIKAKGGPAYKESTKYEHTTSTLTCKEPIEVYFTF